MTEQATIATFEGQPVRASFPLHVTMFGIACVCIPETQYRSLIDIRPSKGRHAHRRLSRLDKDAEVRAFIEARFDHEEISAIRLAAIERFGADRVPSKSSFHRFVVQLRARSRQAS